MIKGSFGLALDSPIQCRKSCFPSDIDWLGHTKWKVPRMVRGMKTESYASCR